MYILIIIAAVVLLAVIRPTFLAAIINGLANFTREVWGYLAPILPYYIWGTLIAIGAIAAFIILGVVIDVPAITGTCFLLSIALFYLVFLVPGLFLRLMRANQTVFPPAIKTAAAWLAVLGFLGMFSPEALSFNFLIGASLLAFIALGIATKTDFLTKVAYPVVLVMCCIVVWKFVAPDNFRATTRHLYARSAQVNSWNDRRSIEAEADAFVTYARPNRRIGVVYTATIMKDEDGVEYISSMSDTTFVLTEKSQIKVFNHKTNVMTYQGQGFVQMQIAKANGSFVNASTYWIEADYLIILSPGDLAEEKKLAEERERQKNNMTQSQIQSSAQVSQTAALTPSTPYNTVGSYLIAEGNKESDWIEIGDCHTYNFSHDKIEMLPFGAKEPIKVWQIANLPNNVTKFKIINRSSDPVSLFIKT